MLNILKLIFSLISVCVISRIETARILGVFPAPSISHQVVFRPIMLELAKRGHYVTVITTDPVFPKGAPKNLTEIDVHDISYAYKNKWIQRNLEVLRERDPITLMTPISDFFSEVFEIQLKSPQVQKLIHDNDHFDLILFESSIRPALVFSYIYKVPVIAISTVNGKLLANENIGAAAHPLIYPHSMHRRIYNLTIWEKISEMYVHYLSDQIYVEKIESENEMLRSIFGPDVPDLRDLQKNVHMLFLNVHPIWDFNRPVPPNVVYLGGVHQKPPSQLPQGLKSYLDSSENGVIYVSFGTNIKPSSLPPEIIKIFTNVFSQLPYDVLWKWDTEELPGRSENVRISKWLPQSDLLRHPNVKLFIMQGGLQSTDEALTAGVPLVGIPMNGDQWFNVEHFARFNIGLQLSIDTLTESKLNDAITTAFDNNRFRENIKKLHNIMYDQPLTPLERAVWWAEHVIRHGGAKHLGTAAANISWIQYYELYLVLFLLCAIIMIAVVTLLTIYLVISKVKLYKRLKVKKT